MSQISPPIRIVLVAVIGLLAAWMLFLRPKTEPVPAPNPASATAPGVTGLSNAVDGAKAAAAAQEKRDVAANKAMDEETGASTGTGVKPVAKAGQNAAKGGLGGEAAPAKGLPAPVQKALDANQILVLSFFNPKSADDRATRKALGDVNRWKGEVVVRTADIKAVSRYGSITRGAEVEQSPTIVVVDRNAKAETLVGYQDSVSIDQAVVDAMRASGGLIEDKYLAAVNGACATASVQGSAIPEAQNLPQFRSGAARGERVWKRFVTRFAAIKAPKRWKAFKAASLRDARAVSSAYADLGSASLATAAPVIARGNKAMDRWNARMDKQNVLSCGTQS